MRSIQHQLIRFGIVGILATAIHAGIFVFLAGKLKADASLANLAAYLVSWIAGYFGHAYFSFAGLHHQPRPNMASSLFRYMQASVVTLAVSALIVHLIVDVFRLSYLYCVPLLVSAVPTLAFVLNRYWVFRPHPPGRPHAQDKSRSAPPGG